MMKRICLTLIVGSLVIFNISANPDTITVVPSNSAVELINTILGSGVSLVGAPTFTGGPSSTWPATFSAGTFTGGIAAGIGIDSGIILTSGDVNFAPGPNLDESTTGYFGGAGDGDLTGLSGYDTYDATILEFDFQTDRTGDLIFKFVFASEEYIEYVNSSFNDVFAFFLDGENLAVVPGSDPPVPISINTINHLVYSSLYNDNPASAPAFDIEYDGFTIVLTAQKLGLESGTHHMKLAIADASDEALDSAVFIEAGSFTFVEIEVPLDIKPMSCPNALNVNHHGVLPVAILGTAELDVTQIDPVTIKLQGVDTAANADDVPLRWAYEDVATPFMPYMGKTGCGDCNELGPDGYLDLTIKFTAMEIAKTFGEINDGDCVRLTITGKLHEEFGGTDFVGEDWVILRKKK